MFKTNFKLNCILFNFILRFFSGILILLLSQKLFFFIQKLKTNGNENKMLILFNKYATLNFL